MIDFLNKKILWAATAISLVVLLDGYFFYALSPMNAQKGVTAAVFEIRSGEGFNEVGSNLSATGFIRSAFVFDVFLLFSGRRARLQPGEYQLNRAMSIPVITDILTDSVRSEVTVTVPEGSNVHEIDRILSAALVIRPGDLINFHDDGDLEGRLFPDTYHFFTGTDIRAVVQKFFDDWDIKAKPMLGFDESQCAASAACEKKLILASIVEKEVPDLGDQKIVVGILLKRLTANMYLDLDATICYAKQALDPFSATGCYPLSSLDFKIDSPYNTYSHKGLPPTPVSNPGASAISAVQNSEGSSYWYYLSDPKTKKTIFAKTLEEQNRNRHIYLGL